MCTFPAAEMFIFFQSRVHTHQNIFTPNFYIRALQPIIPDCGYANMTYDLYCPTNKDINSRVCKKCGIYHSSMAAVKRHTKGGCTEQNEGDVGVLQTDTDEENENALGIENEMLVDMEEQEDAPILNI